MASEDGFTLRKRIAMGLPLPSGNFGAESLASAQGAAHTPEAHLKDHERAASPPVGHNQANPNHGEFK